jgi:hypothetical protein
MAFTICRLAVVSRIGSGAAQKISLDPADPKTDILQALDPALVPLSLLPQRVSVYRTGNDPTEQECRNAVVPLVQSIGAGEFDISPAAVKTAHMLVAGSWEDGYGFGFQLLENGAKKTSILKARNTTNVATQISMDWLVLVSL